MSSNNLGKNSVNAESGVLLDLFDINKLRRALLYAMLMLIVITIQDTFCSHIKILGVRPLIVPVIVVAAGAFEGGSWGGFFGLACGLLADTSFLENTIFFTILFPALGFFSGLLVNFFINKRFFSYLILCAAALALVGIFQAVRLWLTNGSDPEALSYTAALQTLWSLPFSVPVYFICRALNS